MKAFTDYPFTELGDIPHKISPIREVEVLSYDGDKYCKILVEGLTLEIKSGYLYKDWAYFGDSEPIHQDLFDDLPQTKF